MNRNEHYIGPVRPIFNISEEPKGKGSERLAAGNEHNGIVIDTTKDGVEINAYYTGFNGPMKYAALREPVVISWDELYKMRERVINNGRKSRVKLDRVEVEIDAKYLKTLPVVTINSKRYYIDPRRRERRSVDKPEEVWCF